MKLLAVQMNPTLGDIAGNMRKILGGLERASKVGADIVLFPELAVTGYPPEDLLLDGGLIEETERQLEVIQPLTKGMLVVLGLPRKCPWKGEKFLCNSVAVFKNGELLGFKDKTLLPTYDVFDEKRYFSSGKPVFLVEHLGRRIAVTICEDLWQHSALVGYTRYEADPVVLLKEERPDLVLNLSASPYYFKRKETRGLVCRAAAKTLDCPVVLCNQVGAHDQLVFDGHSLYCNEKGELIQRAKGFVEDDLMVDMDAHVCPCPRDENGMSDLYQALVLGVKDYFGKQGFSQAVVGLSGGIDSALVACIACDALGAKQVKAVALPTRFSSPDSYSYALTLAERLGIELQKIDIDELFQDYLDLFHLNISENLHALVEENVQARIRGMILMAISNQEGSLLLNTSNKTEMAMGYTTLYGDLCGGLSVLSDVSKLRVYELCHFVNRKEELIPQEILQRAPSAELKARQTDQDTLPPYDVLDPILEDYIEKGLNPQDIAMQRNVSLGFVQDLIRKIHLAEYKRRQAPIGIRVTQKSFSKGRVVPIVQRWR